MVAIATLVAAVLGCVGPWDCLPQQTPWNCLDQQVIARSPWSVIALENPLGLALTPARSSCPGGICRAPAAPTSAGKASSPSTDGASPPGHSYTAENTPRSTAGYSRRTLFRWRNRR